MRRPRQVKAGTQELGDQHAARAPTQDRGQDVELVELDQRQDPRAEQHRARRRARAPRGPPPRPRTGRSARSRCRPRPRRSRSAGGCPGTKRPSRITAGAAVLEPGLALGHVLVVDEPGDRGARAAPGGRSCGRSRRARGRRGRCPSPPRGDRGPGRELAAGGEQAGGDAGQVLGDERGQDDREPGGPVRQAVDPVRELLEVLQGLRRRPSSSGGRAAWGPELSPGGRRPPLGRARAPASRSAPPRRGSRAGRPGRRAARRRRRA